ncbi:hypothetical protein H4582DRAFT_2054533 [Lactarius indigo]|nr:hypothetical protein H4582DRAFT_2054533 [Lactarius indigo]
MLIPMASPPDKKIKGCGGIHPQGAAAASNSFEVTQREFQPRSNAGYPPAGRLDGEQPGQRNTVSLHSEPQSRRPMGQTRIGRPSNDEKEEVTQEAFPATSPKNKYQERRSYHPNPPTHRSDWVMWVGNELREFFNQPLPLPPSKRTEPPKDRQQVYGGVSTVFLISRSSCALSTSSLRHSWWQQRRVSMVSRSAPMINGARALCAVFGGKKTTLMAGVGAQRGNAMHIKWVKEHKAKVQREQGKHGRRTEGRSRGPQSPLSVSSDDSRETEEGGWTCSLEPLALTFYREYELGHLNALLPSALLYTQILDAGSRHNEEILDQAYRTSKDVFLIFSVNKSGGFYGYARMAGPVLQDENGVLWASATGSTSLPLVSPDDTGAKRQRELYILPPDERRDLKQSPQFCACWSAVVCVDRAS